MLETIFVESDDFCKQLEKITLAKLLGNSKKRNKSCRLTSSEVMTICIYYHYSGYKTFKDFYTKHVLKYMQKDFNGLVSYTRFVELKQEIALALYLFLRLKRMGQCNGLSIIDSFPIKSCHVRRASSHKTFKKLASKGKSSIGWFYGFKVHLIINSFGQIINFDITSGNVADNNKKLLLSLTKNIYGKMCGDRGYIGRILFFLKERGIRFFHKIKKNMKNILMDLEDKLFLRKRGLIETVNGLLKESFSIEHTRHRSLSGFFSHICSAMIAFTFRKAPIQSEFKFIS